MLQVKKLSGALGAEIRGVDLSQPLKAETVAEIRRAWLDNLVVFFTGQKKLSHEEHIRLAHHFGEIEMTLLRNAKKSALPPELLMVDQMDARLDGGAASWHADNTYRAQPPLGALLQAHILPEVGGDTCFANMYAAYEALSQPMRDMLDKLTAVHNLQRMISRMARTSRPLTVYGQSSEWPPHSHPVVVEHPETGRKLLYVNTNWTAHIEGVSTAESDMLLNFLFEHVKNPAFQVRYHWREGDLGFWDNRVTQHFAVPDYTGRRVMQRVALLGTSEPVGPAVRKLANAA